MISDENKGLMIFAVLCLLFGSILSTVHAEELEEIEATETELFASARELSAEEVCELLKADGSIQQVSAFNNDVYYIDNHTLYRYDTTSDTLAVAYAGEIDVNYFIPGESGAIIGTTAPTNENGQVYTTLEPIPGLLWDGEYYYYDYGTEKLSEINDPGLRLVTMTGLTAEAVSYSTTINGKSIPHSSYPPDESYFNGNVDGATQCQGFGYFILNYLYGSYNNTIEEPDANEQNNGEVLFLGAADIIETYPLGSLIRAIKQDETRHTMIYIGGDDSGIYVYHANWASDGEAQNIVHISYFTNAAFAEKFPKIAYMKYHSHSYSSISTYSSSQHKKTCVCGSYTTAAHTFSSWTNYSSSQHRRTCSSCGYTEYKSHSVSTWSYYSTVQHKGTCSTCSGVVYQAHTYNSYGSCTKCGPNYINRKITTVLD